MYKIMVTGANGQMGSEIGKLTTDDHALDYLFTDVDELDITDLKAVEAYSEMHKPDFIINCAAYTNVDKAESYKEAATKINYDAVRNLFRISKYYGIPIIHLSTDYVFDGKSNVPYKEIDPARPVTIYGISKLKGEEALTGAYKPVIIRTSWLYSTFGHNFVKTILRLSNEKDEIRVVNDQIGSPTYAEDLAKVILNMVHLNFFTPKKYVPGIYHYSNEGSCSWYEFAKEILQLTGSPCKVLPVTSSEYPTPAKRPAYSLLDKTKIKETFGLTIPQWKDSLQTCLTKFS